MEKDTNVPRRRLWEGLRRPTLTDWIIAVAAACAVFVAFRQTGIIGVQTDIQQAQAELAHTAQRAWVGVERIEQPSDDALNLGATVYIRNSGGTPALGFEQKLNNRLIPSNEPFEPSYKGASRGSVGVLFPGGKQIGIFPSHTWKPEEVEALKKETSILYRYGEIIYYDVFAREHWTTFCERLVYRDSDPVGWAWEVNDTYNGTDDEDPKERE